MTMSSSATTGTFLSRVFQNGPLRIAIVAVAVLTVVALAVAGWFGVVWYRVAHDQSRAVSADREAVLRDAQQATASLNTLDFHRVQDGLTQWEQASAGSLLNQLKANRNTYAHAITESATSTSATVIDAAVASLDERAGTAAVLVGFDVTSQAEGADPSCVHRRVHLQMIRTGDSWKVGALDPVGDSYSEAGLCPAPSSPK
jgi:Mce-associated membrane protein